MPTDWVAHAHFFRKCSGNTRRAILPDMANCCSSWKSFSDHPEASPVAYFTGNGASPTIGGSEADEAADQAASAICEIDLNQGVVL